MLKKYIVNEDVLSSQLCWFLDVGVFLVWVLDMYIIEQFLKCLLNGDFIEYLNLYNFFV